MLLSNRPLKPAPPPPPTDKPRGYAFITYESKTDMKEAYKSMDGLKIEGRRVLVDVERGRTVDGWWVFSAGVWGCVRFEPCDCSIVQVCFHGPFSPMAPPSTTRVCPNPAGGPCG